MTSGGAGMSYGDDYVAARIAVDVPEGSSAAVRELTQEIERFHVTMEAAVRAEADGSRYLDQMAESTRRASEALQTYNQEMQMSLSMQARGGGFSMGVPEGAHVQPFQASGAGTGVGSAPGTGSGRMPSPSDVAYQIQNNPGHQQEYLNMQQARGRMTGAELTSLTPESISELANKIGQREQQAREQANKTDGNTESKTPPSGEGTGDTGGGGIGERIARTAGLAGQVMNEVGPGGSIMGMGNLALRGIAAARRRSAAAPGRGTPSGGESTGPDVPEDGAPGTGAAVADAAADSGGALAGIGKMLGPLGAAITGAMGVFGVFEKGGKMVQGWRNEASVRGGAAGEGAEVSMKARMLSMNPFLTQDQARQIYQSVMSEGYADASGAGADNVIDFMTHNLTTMNMSVAESAKALRSIVVGNVKGDDDSVAGAVKMLGTELDTIRTMSRAGKLSQPDFRAGAMALQGSLIDQGVDPTSAANQSITAEAVGAGDQNLKGGFAAAEGDLSSSLSGQMLLRTYGGTQVPGDLLPGMTTEYLGQAGKLNEATWNTMKHFAMVYKRQDRGGSSHKNAIYMFKRFCEQYFPSHPAAKSIPAAEALYNQLTGGDSSNDLSSAEQLRSDSGPSLPDSGGGDSGDSGQASFSTPSGGGDSGSGGDGGGGGAANATSYAGGGGGGALPAQNTNVSGSVTVGLTPDAQRLLQVMGGGNQIQLTKTQIGANAGIAGYAINAKAPGEQP